MAMTKSGIGGGGQVPDSSQNSNAMDLGENTTLSSAVPS